MSNTKNDTTADIEDLKNSLKDAGHKADDVVSGIAHEGEIAVTEAARNAQDFAANLAEKASKLARRVGQRLKHAGAKKKKTVTR